MLEIYKSTETRVLEKVDTISKGCWVNIYDPTPEEIARVSNDAGIDIDIIKDALDDEERPRIERDDGRVYIIVDFPYVVQDESGLEVYETIPIGIIQTKENMITVSLKDSPIIEEFRRNRVKEFFTFKKTRFALQLLFVISSFYLRYLKQINKKTNDIERQVHESLKNKDSSQHFVI